MEKSNQLPKTEGCLAEGEPVDLWCYRVERPSRSVPRDIPSKFISHWRPLASAPAWPQPRSGASPWRDIYLCPPANGQSVWLRRCGEDTAAFRAVFDRPNFMFTLPGGWQIQWYQAWRWRAG